VVGRQKAKGKNQKAKVADESWRLTLLQQGKQQIIFAFWFLPFALRRSRPVSFSTLCLLC
jgi:hypothetical protein